MIKEIKDHENFKRLFLQKFTEELIWSHSEARIYKLKKILDEKKTPSLIIKQEIELNPKKTIKKTVQEIINERNSTPKKEDLSELKKEIFPKKQIQTIQVTTPQKVEDPFASLFQEPKTPPPSTFSKKNISSPKSKSLFRNTNLPERLRYLQPEISHIVLPLGRINSLIQDSDIHSIECQGEDTPIIINTATEKKSTKIKLNKFEIEKIIQEFSRHARIPLQNGITEIALGNLSLLALLSESKIRFKIEKIKPSLDSRTAPSPL